MGLNALIILMFSKTMFETEVEWEWAQVLILNPFWVPMKSQFLTTNPSTLLSWARPPRLPMLIPWPGPHLTLLTCTFFVPESNATQSSPEDIAESETVTLVDMPMWTPSVLGLFPGARILMSLIVMLWQEKMFMWVFLLLIKCIWCTREWFTKSNLNDWKKKKKKKLQLTQWKSYCKKFLETIWLVGIKCNENKQARRSTYSRKFLAFGIFVTCVTWPRRMSSAIKCSVPTNYQAIDVSEGDPSIHVKPILPVSRS